MSKEINKDKMYDSCSLCPRACEADRIEGKTGFCGETDKIKVAYAGLHNGEEPPISGKKGSGTIFFTGCTLQCPFCQNYQISRDHVGSEVTAEELADIFLALRNKGASNINFVSGTHFTPGIIEAIKAARIKGLEIPTVWNSSGYDTIETLELLLDYIDIFLPDIKTLDSELSRRLFGTPDYPERIKEGLLLLKDKVPVTMGDDEMKSGIILRHLVLPGEVEASKEVLKWFKENLYDQAILSLMFQYTPLKANISCLPEFSRPVTDTEYNQVIDYLYELEIEEGFIQELKPEDLSWSPDFHKKNPFSSKFSTPVWSHGEFH